LNVMTGVFCQSAIESAQHDYDMVIQHHLCNKKQYLGKITSIFREIDTGTGTTGEITIEDFERYLQNEKVQAYFSSLELEPSDAWTLFKLLDQDGSHYVDIDEFIMGCLRLKGSAKAIELAKIEYEMKVATRSTKVGLKRVERMLRKISQHHGIPVALPSGTSTDFDEAAAGSMGTKFGGEFG